MKVTNRDFVVAYATSQTIDDMVSATNLTKPAINYRAKKLKAAGVLLPKLKMARQVLNDKEVKELNNLLVKYSPKKY